MEMFPGVLQILCISDNILTNCCFLEEQLRDLAFVLAQFESSQASLTARKIYSKIKKNMQANEETEVHVPNGKDNEMLPQ